MARKTPRETLPPVSTPLSFNSQYQSSFWKEQIEHCRKNIPDALNWAAGQIKDFVRERNDPQIRRASEVDLLRLAGAFEHLGVHVGPYLLKGYDCPYSSFQFLDFPKYPCPLEIKNRSSGFKYQIKNYPTSTVRKSMSTWWKYRRWRNTFHNEQSRD